MELAAIRVMADLDGWQALATVVKAATYGTSLASAGGVVFLTLFSGPISAQEDRALRRFLLRMAWIAMPLSALRIAVMNGMLSGEPTGMLDVAMTRMVLESGEGAATGLRVASLMVIAILYRKQVHGVGRWVAVSAAALAATSFALVGHAGEVAMKDGFGLVPQGLLCIHLIAVSFWLGALWPLQTLTNGNDTAKIAEIMERFGRLAAVAVGLLIFVGTLLLYLLLSSTDALLFSAYGQLVMVKLAWVALLLALAAFNKLRLTPQLLNGDQMAAVKLRRSIKAEIVVVGLILLATASFTTLVGPDK